MNLTNDDPLLHLYGAGGDLWADEHADEYVHRLRKGWDESTVWHRVEQEDKPETPPEVPIP